MGMDIYLKFGDVKGDSTHIEHPQWIEASSFQWGVKRAVTTEVGSSGSRLPSHPVIGEITLIKEVDGASASLLQEATTGSRGKTCLIDICAGIRNVVCHFELQNALISSVTFAASAGPSGGGPGETMREEVTISFTKILFKYVAHDADNVEMPPTLFGYDISTASKA